MPLRLRFFKRYARRNKVNNLIGFTLIELLVVVMIIGILVAVALPAFTKMIGKAETQECITKTRYLADRQKEYYTENQTFTTSIDQLNLTPRDADKYNYSTLESPLPGYKGIAHIGMAKNPILGGCFSVVYIKNSDLKMCTPNQIWSIADLNSSKMQEKCQ